VRIVMIPGCRNSSSHPSPDSLEQVAAYADLHSDGSKPADIDWHSAEFERIAEQTLGGNRLV
jgi:hypothetical protein